MGFDLGDLNPVRILAGKGSIGQSGLAPLLEAVALNAVLPGLGMEALSPMETALAVGGANAVASGSIQKGLMAGIGAYGASGLMGGVSDLGLQSTIGDQVASGSLSQAEGETAEAYQQRVQDAIAKAKGIGSSTGALSNLGSGLSAAANSPSALANQMGGYGSLAKSGLMALAPMAAAAVPTTPMPSTSSPTARIMPYHYSMGRYTSEGSIPASNFQGFNQPTYVTGANGGLTSYASGGSVERYDGGGATDPNINAVYDPNTINSYIAQHNLSGDALTAAEQQFHVTPQQVNYAQGLAQGDTATPGLYVNGSNAANAAQGITQGSTATPGLYVNGSPAAAAAENAPVYNTYTPDQIAQYVQTSGINLNDPAAVAAAEKTSNIDPAAYNAWAASNANPFSAAALANPTTASVNAFDASLGTNPANIDIGNAVHTAYADTGATSNLAGNVAGNTQLAQEMDAWHVPPSQMAAALKMDPATIQKLYDAVDPKGPYASPAAKTVTPTPTPTPSGTNTVTTQNGTVLNTYTAPGTNVPTVLNPVNRTTTNVTAPTNIATAPASALASGVGGSNALVNPNGTISQPAMSPNAPTMSQIIDAYTKGGGHVGGSPGPVATSNTGQSAADYAYLMGKSDVNPILNPITPTGQISKDYGTSVMGLPEQDISTKQYLFDPATKKYVTNPDFMPVTYDPNTGKQSYGMSNKQITSYLSSNPNLSDSDWLNWMHGNNISAEQLAAATGVPLAEVLQHIKTAQGTAASTASSNTGVGTTTTSGDTSGIATGGSINAAGGGAMYAQGGIGHLGDYSDGGRLLKGPGDGVSDSIPATIGQGRPARLADGEFVVPARIVSELGNGSTDAGARKLYAMMDRVQSARGGTVGKGRVAKNTQADRYLPA